MAHKLNLQTVLRVSLLLLLMLSVAPAATITVGPGAGYDFESIQAAIDASVDGDTVLMAPGEYVITEPITFRGKAITVKSEAGPDETTIRMGTPADTNRGSVVIFENSESAESILEGFTITGGRGFWFPSDSQWGGGGILFVASSGTVRNCIIVQNSTGVGGGVFVWSGSSTTLTNCIITKNSAGFLGGGVVSARDSFLTMADCIISSNTTMNSGGGAVCWYNGSLTLTNCIVRDNSAENSGGGLVRGGGQNSSITATGCAIMNNTARQQGGGGMDLADGFGTLTNCIIAQNMGGLWGGGLLCVEPSSSTTIINCTIYGNSAGEDGGGLGCYNGASTTLTNSIVWANTAPRGQAIYLEQSPTTFSISYSDVADDQTTITVEGGSILSWGTGNIDADPLFADPNNGDFHLKSQAGRWDPAGESWVMDDVTSPCIDAGDPNSPVGDEPEPNGGRINMGAYGGTAEASKTPPTGPIVYIQWLGHSSVKLWAEDCIVYVDPQRLSISPHDATLVCVTHTHGDHYSPADIARVSNDQTQFVAPPDVVRQYGKGENIAPGQTIESYCARLTAVASYNTNKTNHPKANNWVGYIIELGGKRIYIAGDTDLIEEMKSLGKINVAILPAGGTYTMNAVEAAEATQYIKPDLAIPYHWGQNVGTLADAQRFAQLARCAVKIMAAGETISSDEWPQYSPLIAHWRLDEAQGSVAADSAGDFDGTLHGAPAWRPAGGRKAGALQLDGLDDYISTPFVSNPAEGAFSVFAWVKDGIPGQVIVSQADGAGEMWLGADTPAGNLMSGLVPPPSGRSATPALKSEFIITDGQWHHVGFVFDGSRRYLYADGVEVAKDTVAIASLKSAAGGLNLGAGKGFEAGSFWLGLLDDVRIYDVALSAERIEAWAN